MNKKIGLGLAAALAGLVAGGPAMADCYARGDTGYAWNGSDDAHAINADTPGPVTDVEFDDGWFAEIGLGCGRSETTTMGGIKDAPVVVSTGRGFRGDVTVGWREERDFDGTPPTISPDDPVHTSVQTWTLMFNGYYDFGNFHGFTPYVGAGIGAAFHDYDDIVFTDPGTSISIIKGGDDTNLAWALMAGFSRDVGHRGMLLDVGYRYLDMGEISDHVEICGCTYRLDFENTAHELRVGLRVPLAREEEAVPLK